jgi:two-component system, NarL family, nitrate/nitrite response regulator NarL
MGAAPQLSVLPAATEWLNGTSTTQRVLVVEDHAVVRHALVALINGEAPSLACVGTAATIADALALTKATQPHWVLLDAHLGSDDGIALIPSLRALATCRVLVLSSQLDDTLAAYALRLGATACVHKVAPVEDLLHALSLGIAAQRTGGDESPVASGARTLQAGLASSHPSVGP